jgi:hypothetical protein
MKGVKRLGVKGELSPR